MMESFQVGKGEGQERWVEDPSKRIEDGLQGNVVKLEGRIIVVRIA